MSLSGREGEVGLSAAEEDEPRGLEASLEAKKGFRGHQVGDTGQVKGEACFGPLASHSHSRAAPAASRQHGAPTMSDCLHVVAARCSSAETMSALADLGLSSLPEGSERARARGMRVPSSHSADTHD